MKPDAFLLFVSLFLASSVHAVEPTGCIDKDTEKNIECGQTNAIDPCSENRYTMEQICPVLRQEMADLRLAKAVQKVLNRNYRGNHSPKAKAAFEVSQRKWRDFRDANCKFTATLDVFEETSDFSKFPGGLSIAACKLRLTEQRASELESLLQLNWSL